MNNKPVTIGDISIEQFRLKSLRRKKRWQKRDAQKRLRKLYEESRAISEAINNLGYETLNPPIQRGWKRSFVLREDVSKSKRAGFFQGILDKINTVEYSWRKDFKRKRRSGGRKIYVLRPQSVRDIYPWDLSKVKLSAEEMSYFGWVMTARKIGREFIWVHRFEEPWRFKLKVEPNIIMRTKIKDLDLERRADEIKNYIDRNNLWPKIFKVVEGRYQWRRRYHGGDLARYHYDPLKNKTFADILDEYYPETNSGKAKIQTLKPEGFFIPDKQCRFFTCRLFPAAGKFVPLLNDIKHENKIPHLVLSLNNIFQLIRAKENLHSRTRCLARRMVLEKSCAAIGSERKYGSRR